jgi:16S rRNA processing protein RimM
MTRDECMLLGSITKTHGVHGELILRTKESSFEPDEKWESLFLEIDGIMVPFFISEIHKLREGEWVLGFDDIADKSMAESLTGHYAWILRDLFTSTPDTISPEQLVGFTVHDKASGKSGRIREFVDIPGNPVFEAVIDGQDHIFPARDEFILDLNMEKKSIIMNLPKGLV